MKKFFIFSLVIMLGSLNLSFIWADGASGNESKSKKAPITCTGDKIVYHKEKNMTEGIGNVVIGYDEVKIFSDRGEFYIDKRIAKASGNVVIIRDEEISTGDEITYDFKTNTGELSTAESYSGPWYGKGKTVKRISKNEFHIYKGQITTCDYESPHYTFKSSRIKIYRGDKIKTFNNIFSVKNIPLFWLPYYQYSIDGKRSKFALVPGYSSQFGSFLLTETALEYQQYNLVGTLHTDYYNKRGWAAGLDADHNNARNFKNSLTSYFLRDEDYKPFRGNKLDKDRYKISLDSVYNVREDIRALLDLNLISDLDFLDDFYHEEYKKNAQLNNHLTLTKSAKKYQLGLMLKKRLNNIYSVTERLPELTFNLNSLQIKDTRFYFTNKTYLANLNYKPKSGTGYDTAVFDTINNLSYTRKFFRFLTVQPFLEFKNTYFTKGVKENNLFREAFKTGVSLSTRISRIFNYKNKKWDLNLLRHVIEPAISYSYLKEPSVLSEELLTHGLNRHNQLGLSLRNKLQTRRKLKGETLESTVELIDLNISAAYFPDDYETSENKDRDFSNILFDLEITPYEFTSTRWYLNYDQYTGHLENSYLDFTFLNEEKWSISLGHRYRKNSNNLISLESDWQLTPEWFLKSYLRFETDKGALEEQEFSIIKNLHCWNVALSFKERKARDEKIFFITFYLKDSPGETKISTTL